MNHTFFKHFTDDGEFDYHSGKKERCKLENWRESGNKTDNGAYSVFTPETPYGKCNKKNVCNIDAVISPKGHGAFSLRKPAENQIRGKYAVDLQLQTTNNRGAFGDNSFTVGVNNNAIGQTASAIGEDSNSNGFISTTIGTTINNANDMSLGIGSYGTLKFNDPRLKYPSQLVQPQASLQIAGGKSFEDSINGISMALGTKYFGIVPVGAGTTNSFHSSGTTYAEYFEWLVEPVKPEENIGKFVELVGDKIQLATSNQNAIGVVLGKNYDIGFVGNDYEIYWPLSNLRDEFNGVIPQQSIQQQTLQILREHDIIMTLELDIILETLDNAALIEAIRETPLFTTIQNDTDCTNILVPLPAENKSAIIRTMENFIPVRTTTTNPEYNPTIIYEPRSSRPEWSPIALLGQIRVRDDGTAVVGSKVDSNAAGIATAGTTWRVMNRISANVITILITPH